MVFDAGGLIALEKNDRRVASLIATALEDGGLLIIPATALAQVLRDPARQVRLWRMVQYRGTVVASLDAAQAQAVGALLARTATSDVVDAHVVVCARRADGCAVVTSDPVDLRRLDAELTLIPV